MRGIKPRHFFSLIGAILGGATVPVGFWWQSNNYPIGFYGLIWLVIGMIMGAMIVFNGFYYNEERRK